MDTADIQNALRNRPLDKVVESALENAGKEYEPQLRSLRKQLEDQSSTQGVRDHIKAALQAMEQAQREARRPVLENVAKAVLGIAHQYRIPLQFRQADADAQPKGRPGAATASTGSTPRNGAESGRRGENQTFIFNTLRNATRPLRPSEIKQAAEQAGLNANSIGQTVNKLVRNGELEAVGEGQRNRPVQTID